MSEPDTKNLQILVDQLKKEKERLDAEKAKFDAEKAKLYAEKALADAQKALRDPSSQEVINLQNQKALLDAQKALADSQRALTQAKSASTQELTALQNEKALLNAQKDLEQAKSASTQQVTDLQNQKAVLEAQKALSDAQSQAVLARYIGDVKAGPYSGTVTMNEKAGTAEALLLAARAVKEAASKIAAAIGGKAEKFFLFGAKEFPNFQRLSSFRFRKELVKQAFAAAGIDRSSGPRVESVTPGMVSAGLDAFSKILGFFKTDYTVGGVDAKLDESLLLFAVAGELSKKKEVSLPLLYQPDAPNSAVPAIARELGELIELRTRAVTESASTTAAIADLNKQAADPQNAATKDSLLATAEKLKPMLDRLNGVVALYDSFANSLTTPDPTNGGFPLAVIAQEFSIDAALKSKGAVLLLRLENSGGGHLVKKNLLTGLGRMPLYHMGGATVTYLLLNGSSGRVEAADVVTIYGGFVRTDRLRNELSQGK